MDGFISRGSLHQEGYSDHSAPSPPSTGPHRPLSRQQQQRPAHLQPRPPLLHQNFSAPATIHVPMDDSESFFPSQRHQDDYRSLSFPPGHLEGYMPAYSTSQELTMPPQSGHAFSDFEHRSPIDSSTSEAQTNSASTTDGLFPPMRTPGAEFGADDYVEEGDYTEADPMVEIGESVMTFGPRSGGGAGEGSSAASKSKKKASTTTASQQRLLSEVPVDEEGNATGRRKIQIEYIQDRSRRHITFSKRKAGIMKKAYELSTLTGTQVLLLVVSEAGTVYTYTTEKLEALVRETEGKDLIKDCLDAEDPESVVAADQPAPTPRASARPTTRRLASNPNLRKRASSSALSQQDSISSSAPPVPSIPSHHLSTAPRYGAVGHNYQHHSQGMPMYAAASAVPRYGYAPQPQYSAAPYYHHQQQQQQQQPMSMQPPTSMAYSQQQPHIDYLAPSQ